MNAWQHRYVYVMVYYIRIYLPCLWPSCILYFFDTFFFLIIYSGVSAMCDIYFVYGDVHLFLYLII